MALINCTECGQQVSSMASQCPKCGAPIPKKMVSLLLKRERKLAMGAALGINAYLDGVLLGNIGNGKELSTEISLGKHTLTLSPAGPVVIPGANHEFNIDEDCKSIVVTFGVEAGVLSGKIKIKSIRIQ